MFQFLLYQSSEFQRQVDLWSQEDNLAYSSESWHFKQNNIDFEDGQD